MAQVTIDEAMKIAIGHHQRGRWSEAEGIYRQILAQKPDHADALHLLGALACQLGRTESAIELIGRAIAINGGVAEYHGNLGESYRREGRWEGAISSLRRAIELRPDFADAHGNLGIALMEQGQVEEAIAAYRCAIALRPEMADVHCNLGNALADAGRPDEAIVAFGRAIALRPELAEAHFNLGNVLKGMGRFDEAMHAYQRAIALRPDYANAYNNLGNVFKAQGYLDEALACFRKTVEIDPASTHAASNLVLTLYYHPDHDAPAILEEHRAWARRFADPLSAQVRPHPNAPVRDRRLKIGFVSPDFRAHPVGFSLLPLFSHLDREQFAVLCYSDVQVSDGVTGELRALTDEWHDIAGLSDGDVAERIRKDQIDVLVDLALHTSGNRMLVFARKPSPVQVTMLGMPATTGLSTMDYRLTDRYLDPPGVGDENYTERSIRLPRSFWCYNPPEGTPPVGPLPALANGFVTFGCLNNFSKVTGPALKLWASILQAMPASRLVIHSAAGGHLDAVRARFADSGIAADRVQFVPKASLARYFALYHDLDLSLDPIPFGGGISTMDSLWMGVPVVTLSGRTAVGRGGVSTLSNVGLRELIADVPQRYVEIAVEWGSDVRRLAELRSGLRERLRVSALMDGVGHAADVGEAFRRMWEAWCGQWRN